MKDQIKRAREWRTFRKKHHFTMESLAAVLGISKRAVWMIENQVTREPHPSTLSKFEALKARYVREREFWRDLRDEKPVSRSAAMDAVGR